MVHGAHKAEILQRQRSRWLAYCWLLIFVPPPRAREGLVILLKDLAKDDVLVGTEVWLIDRQVSETCNG